MLGELAIGQLTTTTNAYLRSEVCLLYRQGNKVKEKEGKESLVHRLGIGMEFITKHNYFSGK
jgi:hypothetical protein